MANGADSIATAVRGSAHADRLDALRASAALRATTLATLRALQRLLTAIVLAGTLLTVRPLAGGVVAAMSRLPGLLAWSVPMALLARLGSMRVLAMPVRSAMALATVAAGIRSARVAALGLLARLGAVRAMAVRLTMASLRPGVGPPHVARMLAVRVTTAILAVAARRALRMAAAVRRRCIGSVMLRLALASAAAAPAGGR